MFKALKSLALAVVDKFRKREPETRTRTLYPLIRAGHRLRKPDTDHPQHYPFWTSRRKTKGRRDASLKSRSNRRKAAR